MLGTIACWIRDRSTRRRGLLLVSLIAAQAMTSTVWAAPPKSLSLDDLNGLFTLGGSISLSPNGHWLAIEGQDDVSVLDVRTTRTIAKLGEGIVPVWSPIGSTLAFYSTRSGQRQLWLWSIGDATPRQLTKFPDGIDPEPSTRIVGGIADALRFSWSADGTHLAFGSRVAFSVEGGSVTGEAIDAHSIDGTRPLVLTTTTPPTWTLSGIYAQPASGAGVGEFRTGRIAGMRKANPSEVLFNEIFVIDIASGVTRQLTHDRRTFYHPAWAPSGASIICAAVDGTMVSFDARASDLLSIDAATGVQRVLVGGAGIKFQPRWSPSGSKLAFESRTGLFEPAHLVVIDPTHGGAPATGPGLDRYIFDYEWSVANKAGFIVSYKDGVASRLARVRLDSADVVDLTPRGELPYAVAAFSQSSSGAIAWRQTDPQDLVSVQFLSAEGAHQKMLWKLRPNTGDLHLGRAEIVTWRNSRGEEMEGAMLLPPDHREGERHPLIVDAYPGIGGADWSSPIGGNYAWASMGYVVFRPAPPAPHTWMNPWKGYESSRAARGAEGWKVTFDDVMSGVDALITRGIADGDRMCLFGHSNGGGVVTNLITRTNRFRCAVILAPALADWVRPALMDTNNSVASFAGMNLEDGLDEYIGVSSVFHLASVQTPVLIADGDNDGGFLFDSIEIYNRLRILGKQVTFVRYPGQGHLLSGDALQDFWERELKFFRTYLGDPHS